MSLIKSFGTKDVRVTKEGAVIWFNAKDVAEILGYKQPDKAVRDHVKDDEKRLSRTGQPGRSAGRSYQINESGLYRLMFHRVK